MCSKDEEDILYSLGLIDAFNDPEYKLYFNRFPRIVCKPKLLKHFLVRQFYLWVLMKS